MAPKKDAGKVDAGVRSDAIAKARATGKNQPVRDMAGNLIYYVDGQGNNVADPHPPKAAPPAKQGPGKGVIDPGTRGDAIQQAKVTGKVQPVRDQAGNVMYYVDQQGNMGADPNARSVPGSQDATQSTQDQWDADHGSAPPAPSSKGGAGGLDPASEQQPLDPGQYDSAVQGFYHGGNQTLNGVDQTSSNDPLGINGTTAQAGSNGPFNSKTTQNADGSYTVLAGDGTTDLSNSTFGHQQMANQTGQATFAALNLGSGYSGKATVLFSQGPGGLTPQGTEAQRTNSGWAVGSKQDNRQDLTPGARGEYQNQPMNSAQQQNSAQYMSLQDGLSWFARLSVTDKDAYNSLVGQLNHAGYFASQTGNMNYLPANQLPLNTYSRNAGQALVEAMQDLSVAQMNGESSDMASWLQKRSQGYEDYVKSGAGYNPVNRSYQDPATLAASAKNAAQSAIGRNLTPAEEAKFESAFHGKENAAYNEMDAYGRAKAVNNLDGTSGLPAGTPTGYTAPDTAGEADQYVNQDPQFAAEKQGYQSLELTKGLLAFLKGGSL